MARIKDIENFIYFRLVKYLVFLFSFYILVLAVMPCGDKDDCQHQDTEQSALSDNDQTDHEGDTENCSPFCICACCGHSITAPDYFIPLPFLNQHPAKNSSSYAEAFVSGALVQIWQPPKIS